MPVSHIKSHIKSTKKVHELAHKTADSKTSKEKSKSIFALLKTPFLIFTGWYVLGLITSFFNFSMYVNFFGGLSAWLLILFVYGIFGWNLVEDHSKTISEAVKLAVFLGIAIGFVGAIVGLIMIQTNPAIINYTMQQYAASGVDMSDDQIANIMQISGYIGFVSGPIVNAALGAGLAALGGLIAKKKWIKI